MASNDASQLTDEQKAQFDQTIANALQQWPQNQQAASEPVRAGADAGYFPSVVVLAWMLGATGRSPEGLPYAEIAAERGAGFIAANYASWLATDPNSFEAVTKMAHSAREAGWPLDPFGTAQQLAQQGRHEQAVTFLKKFLTGSVGFPAAASEWRELFDQVSAARPEIEAARAQATNARDRASEQMAADADAIRAERDRLGSLTAEVGELIHQVTTTSLAREYATQAQQTDATATKFTWATLVVGTLTAIGAVALAVVLVGDNQHSAPSILAKGALTLPFVALTAYLGGLAGSFRRMAWHWRHVELQIRTVDPFLAGLDDAQRKNVLAQLALRLFPGQPLDPQNGSQQPPSATNAFLDLLPRSGQNAGRDS